MGRRVRDGLQTVGWGPFSLPGERERLHAAEAQLIAEVNAVQATPRTAQDPPALDEDPADREGVALDGPATVSPAPRPPATRQHAGGAAPPPPEATPSTLSPGEASSSTPEPGPSPATGQAGAGRATVRPRFDSQVLGWRRDSERLKALETLLTDSDMSFASWMKDTPQPEAAVLVAVNTALIRLDEAPGANAAKFRVELIESSRHLLHLLQTLDNGLGRPSLSSDAPANRPRRRTSSERTPGIDIGP